MCYWRVSVALRRRARTKRNLTTGGGSDSIRSVTASAASRRREQQEIRRSRRTNRMLIAMVAIFIVCWLPLNVIILLLEYGEQQFGNWRYILLVFFIAHVVAMSSTVYNPFPRRLGSTSAPFCIIPLRVERFHRFTAALKSFTSLEELSTTRSYTRG